MAFDFDGTGDYITFGSPTVYDNLNPITISAWIVIDDLTNPNGFINKDAIAGWQFYAHVSSLRFYRDFDTTFGLWRTPTSSIATGTLYHVAVTYDNSSGSNDPLLYINGDSRTVTELSTPAGALTSDAASELEVGAYGAGTGDPTNGRVAETAVWNRILSPDEIYGVSRGYSPLFLPNNLVSYIPLVRNPVDVKTGITGTVGGNAVPFTHPRIIYPSESWFKHTTPITPPVTGFTPWRMRRGMGF